MDRMCTRRADVHGRWRGLNWYLTKHAFNRPLSRKTSVRLHFGIDPSGGQFLIRLTKGWPPCRSLLPWQPRSLNPVGALTRYAIVSIRLCFYTSLLTHFLWASLSGIYARDERKCVL